MSVMTLIRSLQSTLCPACGSTKRARQTLCVGCYRALPRSLGKSLYNGVGDGYEEAFFTAMTALKVSEPHWPADASAAVESLRAAVDHATPEQLRKMLDIGREG